MTIPAIRRMSAPGDAVVSPIEASRLVSGHPVATVDNRYSSPDGKFHAGLWTSTVGAWRIHYTEHEYCVLLRGRVRLVSDDGQSAEMGPGDGFVIPSGFSGIWETLEDCLKQYVIYEAN